MPHLVLEEAWGQVWGLGLVWAVVEAHMVLDPQYQVHLMVPLTNGKL
jgi:hypothetical protein